MKSQDLWFLHGKTTTNLHSLKIDKNSGSFQKNCVYKVANLKKKKSTLGLEPLLVEIEHVLDITQKYETPEFFISTCQTDLHNFRKDKKLEQVS